MSEPPEPKKPDLEHTRWYTPEEEPVSLFTRVASNIALLIFLAIVGGVGFLVYPYLSTRRHDIDSKFWALTRLAIGAAGGILFGCIAIFGSADKKKDK